MTFGLAHASSPSNLALSERVADNSSTDEDQVQPPAQTAASSISDDSGKPADTTNTKETATHVRICPHHTLSFQQLQQVASTRRLQEECSLDILVKLNRPHHCKVKDNAKPQICSQIYFRNSARFEPGFQLSASWEVVSSRLSYSDYSKDDMRQMLEGSNVWLCPHTRLCNDWVINAMFRLLKQNEGGRTTKGLEGIRDNFDCCRTAVQVRCLTERPLQELEACLQVNTKRELGQGLCKDDEDWQGQCVPTTDDEGSGSEIDGHMKFPCGVQYLRGIIDPEMPRAIHAHTSGAQQILATVKRSIKQIRLDQLAPADKSPY